MFVLTLGDCSSGCGKYPLHLPLALVSPTQQWCRDSPLRFLLECHSSQRLNDGCDGVYDSVQDAGIDIGVEGMCGGCTETDLKRTRARFGLLGLMFICVLLLFLLLFLIFFCGYGLFFCLGHILFIYHLSSIIYPLTCSCLAPSAMLL
jgi:hypothetical protein